jgi:hypothetical protein
MKLTRKIEIPLHLDKLSTLKFFGTVLPYLRSSGSFPDIVEEKVSDGDFRYKREFPWCIVTIEANYELAEVTNNNTEMTVTQILSVITRGEYFKDTELKNAAILAIYDYKQLFELGDWIGCLVSPLVFLSGLGKYFEPIFQNKIRDWHEKGPFRGQDASPDSDSELALLTSKEPYSTEGRGLVRIVCKWNRKLGRWEHNFRKGGEIKPVGPRGKFQFVVQPDGTMVIGKRGHSLLAGMGPGGRMNQVAYAGEVTFARHGMVKQWTNASGHFVPNPSHSHQAPFDEEKFKNVTPINESRREEMIRAVSGLQKLQGLANRPLPAELLPLILKNVARGPEEYAILTSLLSTSNTQ